VREWLSIFILADERGIRKPISRSRDEGFISQIAKGVSDAELGQLSVKHRRASAVLKWIMPP